MTVESVCKISQDVDIWMEIPIQDDVYIWANYSASSYLNLLVICPQGKYPYLPSIIRIDPQISVFAPEYNFWYLQLGLKENMSKYKERWPGGK
jgi:hypothetical protein